VAYADAERAGSPPVEEVCEFACGDGLPVLLLDTWKKDGTTLYDWLSRGTLQEVGERCRRAGIRVALAGSLGVKHLNTLDGLNAWCIAIRGAACEEGDRAGHIDARRVHHFVLELATNSGQPG
jgi:uncharacterized protein (UPF0264 family)